MRGKKYIAPVVIAVLMIAYYISLFALLTKLADVSRLTRVLLWIVPLLLCSVVIYVLVQRIREIHGGEEDDLDQY